MSNEQGGDQGISDGKRKYERPALRVFGSVRKFTAGSLNVGADSGSGMMNQGSDVRLKENVVDIGWQIAGVNLYLFNYRSEFGAQFPSGRRFGVMAHEVERFCPTAVSYADDGYARVNYEQLGIRLAD